MKKSIVLLLVGIISLIKLNAQNFISLWPEQKMPNSKGLAIRKIESEERISQVKKPGMYSFFPSNSENQGSAVLICPPGGYDHLTYVIAGFQFAKWLNVLGINAFVLEYRLPPSPDLIERELAPLQDAQRAMRIIRANAKKWKIDKDRIGIMGASSGGHLASTLGTYFHDVSTIGDSLDQYSFQPNFLILISPVITMGKYTHQGSKDNLLGRNPSDKLVKRFSNHLQVSPKTPISFIVHASNDPTVHPFNSLLFYKALKKQGISATLHIFPQGGHSMALRNNPGSTNLWTELCEEWLQEKEIFTK